MRVEPTDESFLDAINFAKAGDYDAFVAVGGGSTIDTAKAVNLYTTYPPADFLDYVNPPIGKGLPVPGPLKPLIAIPTTAGTGSETTGVSIFDLTQDARQDRHRQPPARSPRSACSIPRTRAPCRRRWRPRAGSTSSATPSSRSRRCRSPDARCPSARRCARPTRDRIRSATSGRCRRCEWWRSTWCAPSTDPSDDEARAQMLLAASYAGVGFGNAGVHLPHGMSYPVSGNVKTYRAPGYAADHPLVPHGISVILNAPAVFRFTASRQSRAASARPRRRSGANVTGVKRRGRRARARRPDHVVHGAAEGSERPARRSATPSADIPALVEGTLPQHRVTKLSPRPGRTQTSSPSCSKTRSPPTSSFAPRRARRRAPSSPCRTHRGRTRSTGRDHCRE